MSVTVTPYGSRLTIADSTDDAGRQCPYIPGFAISPDSGTWICSFGLTEGDTLTAHYPWPQRIKRSTNQGASWAYVTDISIDPYYLTSDGNVQWVSNWQGNGPAFVNSFTVVIPFTAGTRSYQPGWAQTCYSVSYDDGLTWTATTRLDTLIGFAGPNPKGNSYYADGDFYYLGAGPICELADGTLLYATYNKMSTLWAGNFIYESRVWRSLDHGTTWAQISVPFPHDAGNPQYSWEEPVLGQLLDGSVLCLARTNLNGLPCVSARKSVDGGVTWGTATIPAVGGVPGSISASNRPNFGQAPGGLVLGIFRAHISPSWASDRPLYASSPDGLTGWSSLVDVETNAVAANVAGGGMPSFHGRWQRVGPINTPGNMALIYSVGATVGATYLRRFTVSGEAPASLSLLVTAGTGWAQSGTALTVGAPTGIRAPVQAQVTSLSGGVLRFLGTHGDRFSASLDGVTYTPNITIPAGTSTVYLAVTAQPGDSILTAQAGVPL